MKKYVFFILFLVSLPVSLMANIDFSHLDTPAASAEQYNQWKVDVQSLSDLELRTLRRWGPGRGAIVVVPNSLRAVAVNEFILRFNVGGGPVIVQQPAGFNWDTVALDGSYAPDVRTLSEGQLREAAFLRPGQIYASPAHQAFAQLAHQEIVKRMEIQVLSNTQDDQHLFQSEGVDENPSKRRRY